MFSSVLAGVPEVWRSGLKGSQGAVDAPDEVVLVCLGREERRRGCEVWPLLKGTYDQREESLDMGRGGL
jgi:hypothetical protein